nr:immunoglobulin heavy chain junction region [Mus musculus]
CARSRSNFAYW